MASKILIVVGHPRQGSLSDALANAFFEGARSGGAQVQLLSLRDLHFDPNVVVPVRGQTMTEPDLERARELILWCDQIVFVYPTWWAGVPALLKGFLDRVLTSGFAFHETTAGTGYEGLLQPRSAHLITTMDTPRWVDRWIIGRPGELAMKRGTLGFCGFAPVRVTSFSPVKSSTAELRAEWLQQVRDAGKRAARGRSLWDRCCVEISVWLQAMRLQFYPLTFLAYLAGALAAGHGQPTALHWSAFTWGYLTLFLLEVATVFSNDIFDRESDLRNRFYGLFSGGSRVLIERKIGVQRLGIAAVVAAVLAAVCGGLAVAAAATHDIFPAVALLSLGVLAIGYTVPPLKLSHRGLGELDVCFTHSFGVMVCGHLLQGGRWDDAVPWLMGLPLFGAILPSILLAGIPDREADQMVGKRTLVVMLGTQWTLALAAASAVMSVILALAWTEFGMVHGAYTSGNWIAVPLGAFLVWRLFHARHRIKHHPRVDGLITLALLLALWFSLVMVANSLF